MTWTTAHHVAEWVKDKGEIKTGTMVLLCLRHHWRVHEGGWQIARTDEGVITVPPLGGHMPGCTPDARPCRVVLDDWQAAQDEVVDEGGADAVPDG